MRRQLSGGVGRHLLRIICVVGMALGNTELAAAQSFLPKLGGPGGGSFEETCPAGSDLAGFMLGTADDVDAIQINCIFPTSTGQASPANSSMLGALQQSFGNAGPRSVNILVGKSHGGVRGVPRALLCPAAIPVVLGISIESEGAETVIVNSIALYCGRAIASQPVPSLPNAIFEGPRYNRSAPWMGIGIGGTPSFPDTQYQNCPSGQVAIGIHGRSGLWVDAIGLICGAPRSPPQPQPSPITSIGRVPSTGPQSPPRTGSICDAARAARARNSPAAPNLEAQCSAQRSPISSIGRVGGASAPNGPRLPICDAAASARARNSPAAPNLEAQCAAYRAANPAPPEPAPQDVPPEEQPADDPPQD